MALRETWKSAENLMATFNPSRQSEMARRVDDVFGRSAPSVARFSAAFGEDKATAWLMIQLRAVGEYAGAKDKQSVEQLRDTANVIAVEFGYLTLPELMLFFHRLKSGYYGHFYGAVDGIQICEGLREFLSYRRDQLNRLEREANERARAAQEERDKAECISYSEYLRRKEVINAQK